MVFMIRRLLSVAPTLVGVVAGSFIVTHLLPGDPAVFFASNPSANASTIQAIRATLGMDQPLWRQFLVYCAGLLRGDLGVSITTGQPIVHDLMTRLPASAELTMVAFVLAVVVALPLGIGAALRPHSLLDHVCRLVSTAGVVLPTFVSGLLLIYLFYDLGGIAPEPIGRLDPFVTPPPFVTGMLLIDTLLAGDGATFGSALRHLALPSVTMALFALAPLARMTRASMIAALGSDFTRAARANGLRPRTVVMTYAFRNAMLPVVTTLGMVFSYMLGANVLVEQVFAWPGIGSYALDALISLDYAPVQGFMLLMAAVSMALNLVIDVAYAVIDPRAAMLADG